MESELFGHTRGAFTGAFEAKEGIFEQAHGGTLLLDEIGDMPVSLQAKLLRVLQDLRVRRIGSSEEVYCDVRVIASTNRPIDELLREGTFREDLFHRLNGVRLKIPPLRERKEDIPWLAQAFVTEFYKKYNKDQSEIDRSAIRALTQYNWPGNVRELRHVIERAVVLSDSGSIGEQELPDHVNSFRETRKSDRFDNEGVDLETGKKKYAKDLILKTLDEVNGNRTEAATDRKSVV